MSAVVTEKGGSAYTSPSALKGANVEEAHRANKSYFSPHNKPYFSEGKAFLCTARPTKALPLYRAPSGTANILYCTRRMPQAPASEAGEGLK